MFAFIVTQIGKDRYSLIRRTVNTLSRRAVVSREAKKKQQAHAHTGQRPLQ